MGSFYLIAVICYGVLAYVSYDKTIKHRPEFWVIVVFFSLLANVAWGMIAKMTIDPKELLLRGLVWDILLTMTYVIVPFLFFNIKFDTAGYVGVALILTGILMLKLQGI